jgi:2-haloacid dehalogenase/putative hydrolase of the HAD superfamily
VNDFSPGALLLDFYGTIVEEDDGLIAEICAQIAEASPQRVRPADIGAHWARAFGQLCAQSYGPAFRPQKELELLSLQRVLQHFECGLDPKVISQPIYAYWRHPTLFPETKTVLDRCALPVCLVSNIDNTELQSALQATSLRFDRVVTSDDCRAYKPRSEMFERALSLLGVPREAALFVGDSLGSDVRGARSAGIRVAWVNRKGRPTPVGADVPDYVWADLTGLLEVLPTNDLGHRHAGSHRKGIP